MSGTEGEKVVEHDEDVNEEDMDESHMSSCVEEEEEDQTDRRKLAHKESKTVSRFRVLLLVVLFGLAIAFSVLAYFSSRNQEQEEFEETFQSHAEKVRRPAALISILET